MPHHQWQGFLSLCKKVSKILWRLHGLGLRLILAIVLFFFRLKQIQVPHNFQVLLSVFLQLKLKHPKLLIKAVLRFSKYYLVCWYISKLLYYFKYIFLFPIFSLKYFYKQLYYITCNKHSTQKWRRAMK